MTGLDRLAEAGVSVWLDDLGRERLVSGDLARLVAQGVRGVTTNPTIFAKAIGDGSLYASDLAAVAAARRTPDQAVFDLAIEDVRRACDVLADVYETSGRVDGRVSLEVDPRLAHDTVATIDQARELWARVDRPNLMVKVPATVAGLPAVTTLIGEGISINVTLIFALERYEEVLDAWMAGLELAHEGGRDLSAIGSVASFFVSRVDTMVDPLLEDAAAGGDADALRWRGMAALANARLAYQRFRARMSTPPWQGLAAAGARPQRPLWASTSTKNPAYDPTMYVTGLVAPTTVNTLPAATLATVLADAGLASAAPPDTVTEAGPSADRVMAALEQHGIDMADVVAQLERDGVASFADSWTHLVGAVGDALEHVAP
ncbi:MAG: transaldolase [Actinomycetes bacterium]